MKRRVLLSSLIALAVFVVPVYASTFWKVDISGPQSLINSRTFNIGYAALSTEASDQITVELFENGVAKGAPKTTTEPYGDSGDFPVTVPTDGTYSYYLTTSNNNQGSGPNTATKTVTVDTTPPAAVVYQGVVRDGNKYTLTFTAPADGDVTTVRIYSSPSSSFTADASTLVGTVTVAPGETKVFVYTAPDDRQRFHAVQAFDGAGNPSSLVGDRNISVTQGQVGGNGTGTGGAGAVGDSSQTPGDQNGQNSDVLGQKDDGGNHWWWLLLALVIFFVWFMFRRGRGGEEKSSTSSAKKK